MFRFCSGVRTNSLCEAKMDSTGIHRRHASTDAYQQWFDREASKARLDQAAMLQPAQQRVQSSERKLKVVMGTQRQLLSEPVAVALVLGQQRQDKRLGVSVQKFSIQVLHGLR